MILAAWSHSLEYSIGTSSHGVNVMNAVCEKLGFVVDKVFRKVEAQTASEWHDSPKQELDQFMRTASVPVDGGTEQPIGADREQLTALGEELRASREQRTAFRRKAASARDMGGSPLEGIRAVVSDRDKRFSGALFPTLRTVCAFYKPKAVMRWAVGQTASVSNDDISLWGGATGLPFKIKGARRQDNDGDDGGRGDGGAKEHDFAWLVLSTQTNKEGTGASWRACADQLQAAARCATLFDMHNAGIADAVYMLASSENKRCACPEMPARLPFALTQTQAFRDEKGAAFHKGSVEISPMPFMPHDASTAVPAQQGAHVACRPIYDVNHADRVPIHAQIDLLHNRGRFPALMPHTSTRVENASPIRWQTGSGIEVNATVVYEHTVSKMEGILRCAKVPGLRGLQEKFLSSSDKGAPPCLRADALDPEVPLALVQKAERVLPYSIDVQQMAWTIELAERFYNTSKKQAVTGFNHRLRAQRLPSQLKAADLPEISLRYPGFPKDGGEPNLRLVSVPVGDSAPVDEAKKVEISKANPLQSMDAELLRYQTEVAIGRAATLSDIEEHRRSLIGTGYVWGVTGDVFNYDTWQDHLCASMIGRGNVDPAEDREHGGFEDKAFESVLDAELMLDARLVERRAAKGELPEAKYKLSMPAGSTYRYQEAVERAAHARVTGGKRVATAPPASLLPNKRSGSGMMANRYNQFVTHNHSPSLANGSPSLAVSRSRHGGAGPSRRQDSHDDED